MHFREHCQLLHDKFAREGGGILKLSTRVCLYTSNK